MDRDQKKPRLGEARKPSRYDDATQDDTKDPLIDQYFPAHTTVTSTLTPPSEGYGGLSDAEIKKILLEDGLLQTEKPQNVLDIRRQWPSGHQPVPTVQQLNRIIYKLRDEGKVLQCRSNGTKSQKPCWALNDFAGSNSR